MCLRIAYQITFMCHTNLSIIQNFKEISDKLGAFGISKGKIMCKNKTFISIQIN